MQLTMLVVVSIVLLDGVTVQSHRHHRHQYPDVGNVVSVLYHMAKYIHIDVQWEWQSCCRYCCMDLVLRKKKKVAVMIDRLLLLLLLLFPWRWSPLSSLYDGS